MFAVDLNCDLGESFGNADWMRKSFPLFLLQM